MNKGSFTKILSNPDLVSEETLKWLKEIVDEYPFFQAGRMLLLKNMHELDHIRYNSELKHSAVYIADRTKLFFLLNGIGKDQQEHNDNKLLIDKKSEVVQQVKPIEPAVNNEPEVSKEPDLLPEKEKSSKEVAKTNVTISDNYLNASDDYIDETGSAHRFTFSNSNSKVNKKQDDFEDIVLPAADLLDYESTSSTIYSLPDIDKVSKVDPNENRSFSDWLHIMHYTTPEEPKESKEKKKGMDLIDSFLSQDPKIIPSAAKKHKHIDLSEQKEDSSDDILSETLAAIYIKQGHKSKAISIFEKLRLKYPEKNAYFARRINELKEN